MEMYIPMPDETAMRTIIVEWLGGDEALSMVAQHRDGRSYREIANRFGLPRSTVSDRIRAAVSKMERVGIDLGRPS